MTDMDRNEALETLLRSYRGYYNINTETPAEPFAAEATFELHDEQYFLMKSAKLSEADAKEFVFFASVDELTPEVFKTLDEASWETGMSRVVPKTNHRSSDVSLIILADRVDEACRGLIRKANRSKSYKWGFHGYSHYRLIALDLSTGATIRNRMGESLEKTISKIFTF